jgi:hypothetical protein
MNQPNRTQKFEADKDFVSQSLSAPNLWVFFYHQ